MRVRPAVAAACAAVALVSSACSGASPSTGGGVSPQAVSWVDQVCGAMKSVQDAGGTQPNIDQDDAASAVTGLSAYFGGVVTAVQGARNALASAGPSPVANADADVTRLEKQLGQVQAAFQAAHDKIQAVDPRNTQAVATTMSDALTPIQQLDVSSDPIGELRKNPAFDTVAEQVPRCST